MTHISLSVILRDSKVFARRNKDGLYYPAVVQEHVEGNTFVIEFDKDFVTGTPQILCFSWNENLEESIHPKSDFFHGLMDRQTRVLIEPPNQRLKTELDLLTDTQYTNYWNSQKNVPTAII